MIAGWSFNFVVSAEEAVATKLESVKSMRSYCYACRRISFLSSFEANHVSAITTSVKQE
jgi:hypothetical protein